MDSMWDCTALYLQFGRHRLLDRSCPTVSQRQHSHRNPLSVHSVPNLCPEHPPHDWVADKLLTMSPLVKFPTVTSTEKVSTSGSDRAPSSENSAAVKTTGPCATVSGIRTKCVMLVTMFESSISTSQPLSSTGSPPSRDVGRWSKKPYRGQGTWNSTGYRERSWRSGGWVPDRKLWLRLGRIGCNLGSGR